MKEPTIDKKVDDKIDEKIQVAQLPKLTKESVAINLPANTTMEDDLRTQGQRDINQKWETTQQYIAVYVVSLAMLVSSIVVIRAVFYGVSDDANLAIAAYTFISSTTSLIIGFYFSRTNHARIGDDPGKKSGGGLDDR